LGVDVGSITTKVVAVDPHGAVQARRYLPTQGRPLDVVRRALLEVGQELGDAVQVLAVGVTGSGRHLTAEFVGGDVVRSEITAQARAALAVDPEVDTIFEIGGQDSKYIRLAEGAIVNFAMNSACAAGTGSFLEEQADRLQIDLAEEFSRDALCAACPVALGERCTVFMESDLVHHQQQGAHVDNLAAGLAYAIVENYLNRVVGAQTIGRRIFFQGGVAWNDSVVAAFQARLGRPVRVPPHHDVSGAIGAALLARDELTARRLAGEAIASRFRGFDLGALHYAARAFICQACPNLCEINRVTIGDEAPVFYGARCDMYEQAGRGPTVHGAAARPADLPDLFAERERLLMGGYTPPEPHAGRPRVGIPRTLHFYDLFPFWRTFFDALDMDIVLSSMTNPSIARATKDYATAETCYPVKLVFGHVAELLDSAPDFLFLPAIINREHAAPGQNENTYCPYIRSSGHLVEAAMTDRLSGMKVITSRLHMQWPTLLDQDLTQMAAALGIPAKAVRDAAAAGLAAQAAFHAQLRQRGQQVLAALTGETPALVLVGRPYNTADQGCSQDLPYKLRKLGVLPIPLDYLPLDPVDVSDRFPHMFWRCGQDILAGAQIIRDDPRLHAVYVTSFGCGPDSFILSYFRRIMAGKPHLELELDDHTADAGVLTRCEAFVESLRILQQRPMPKEFA
jgi:predicted CoA-substrate-specific enzyme activase